MNSLLPMAEKKAQCQVRANGVPTAWASENKGQLGTSGPAPQAHHIAILKGGTCLRSRSLAAMVKAVQFSPLMRRLRPEPA
jgi:hypothetical protein